MTRLMPGTTSARLGEAQATVAISEASMLPARGSCAAKVMANMRRPAVTDMRAGLSSPGVGPPLASRRESAQRMEPPGKGTANPTVMRNGLSQRHWLLAQAKRIGGNGDVRRYGCCRSPAPDGFGGRGNAEVGASEQVSEGFSGAGRLTHS